MSKEFEEIVLKKLEMLDVLDERTKNTDKVIEETILKTLKEMKRDNAKKFGELEIEVKDTQEVVKMLNQNFTKFDYEINKKINTLFDAYTTNTEKNAVHEEKIVSLNEKTFNHDIRISNLENKVLTA